MSEISLPERLLFAVICAAALFVSFLAFFKPERLDKSFTWALLPPLHARFVGVLYLFGGVYMIGCLLARHRSQVSPALPAIGIFTSLLLLVTLLNLDAFDFDLVPVWVWTVSYIVYPILAFTLAWVYRHRGGPVDGAPLERWARVFLQVQATVFGILGLALLFLRETMVDAWPWPITNGLAQFYAGPFIAYAFCSWAYSRRHAWIEIFPIVLGMLAFTGGTIIVSVVHNELFSAGDVSDWLWFIGFGVATLVLAGMGMRIIQVVAAGQPAAANLNGSDSRPRGTIESR
jgi:hypothetical protein